MESGSKVVSFRLPADLAREFEEWCDDAGVTSGQVLRKLVDDTVYPGAELAAPAEKQLYGVEATAQIVEIVNSQIKAQLEEQLGDLVDEKLELVKLEPGMTEAQKLFYDQSLAGMKRAMADLESTLAQIKTDVDSFLTGAYLKDLAEQAQKVEENPKIIQGKTDKPGYIYYEYLNLSMKE